MEQSIKHLSNSSSARTSTIINEGSELSGEFSINGSMYIYGCVRGSITASNDVAIGQSGRFYGGCLSADHVVVNGVMEGDIIADTVDISSTGVFTGQLFCNYMKIQKGGIILGEWKSKRIINANKTCF